MNVKLEPLPHGRERARFEQRFLRDLACAACNHPHKRHSRPEHLCRRCPCDGWRAKGLCIDIVKTGDDVVITPRIGVAIELGLRSDNDDLLHRVTDAYFAAKCDANYLDALHFNLFEIEADILREKIKAIISENLQIHVLSEIGPARAR